MPQRNTMMVLGAVLLGALLVGAGVAAAGLTDDGGAPQANVDGSTTGDVEDRSIDVTANGQVQAEPDQALVRISIEARDEDPAEARSKVAENASSVREALEELGLDDDQVRTVGFNIYEDRSRPRDPDDDPEITYRARHQFEVELDDVDRVGEVIDAAVDGGATTVNGVQFTLSEETQHELQQEALRDAMDNARTQADTIAESANLSVTGVHSVSTGDVRVPRERVHLAAMAEADAAGTSIDPGTVTVSTSVHVEYEVAD